MFYMMMGNAVDPTARRALCVLRTRLSELLRPGVWTILVLVGPCEIVTGCINSLRDRCWTRIAASDASQPRATYRSMTPVLVCVHQNQPDRGLYIEAGPKCRASQPVHIEEISGKQPLTRGHDGPRARERRLSAKVGTYYDAKKAQYACVGAALASCAPADTPHESRPIRDSAVQLGSDVHRRNASSRALTAVADVRVVNDWTTRSVSAGCDV